MNQITEQDGMATLTIPTYADFLQKFQYVKKAYQCRDIFHAVNEAAAYEIPLYVKAAARKAYLDAIADIAKKYLDDNYAGGVKPSQPLPLQ